MKYVASTAYVIIAVCTCMHIVIAKSSVVIQDHYKKVADGLVGIRKEYPASQPKIYAMLDQLDKLYNTAKNICEQKKIIKKKLFEKANEVGLLKQEVASLKNETSSTHKTLESTKTELAQKLAEEQLRVQHLQQEHKDLSQKIALLEEQKKERELVRMAHKDGRKDDVFTKEASGLVNESELVHQDSRQL